MQESFASNLRDFLPKNHVEWENLDSLGRAHSFPDHYPLHLVNSARSAHWNRDLVQWYSDLGSAQSAALADLSESSSAYPRYFPSPSEGLDVPNPYGSAGAPYSCSFDSLSLAVMACIDLFEACHTEHRLTYLGRPRLDSRPLEYCSFLDLISGTSNDEGASERIYEISHMTWGYFCRLNAHYLANGNGRPQKGLHFGEAARFIRKGSRGAMYTQDPTNGKGGFIPSTSIALGDNYANGFLEWIRYYHSVIRWGFLGTPAEIEVRRKKPSEGNSETLKRSRVRAEPSTAQNPNIKDSRKRKELKSNRNREEKEEEEEEEEEEEKEEEQESLEEDTSSQRKRSRTDSFNLDPFGEDYLFSPPDISGKQTVSAAQEYEILLAEGRSAIGHPERNALVLPHVRDHFMHFYVYNVTAERFLRKLIRSKEVKKKELRDSYEKCFTTVAPLGKIFPKYPPLMRSAYDERVAFYGEQDWKRTGDFVEKATVRSILKELAKPVEASFSRKGDDEYSLTSHVPNPLRFLHRNSTDPKVDSLWGIWKSYKSPKGENFTGMSHFSFPLYTDPREREKIEAMGSLEATLRDSSTSSSADAIPSILSLEGRISLVKSEKTFPDSGLFVWDDAYPGFPNPGAFGQFITRRTLQAKCAGKIYANTFALTRTHDSSALTAGYYFGPLVLPAHRKENANKWELATYYPAAVIWHDTIHFTVDAIFPKEFGSATEYPWVGGEPDEYLATPLSVATETFESALDLELPFKTTHSWLHFDDYVRPARRQSHLPERPDSEDSPPFRLPSDVLRAYNEISRTAKSAEPKGTPFPDVFSAGTCPAHRPVGDSRWTELTVEQNYARASISQMRVKRWGGDVYLMLDPERSKRISAVHYVKTNVPHKEVLVHKARSWKEFLETRNASNLF